MIHFSFTKFDTIDFSNKKCVWLFLKIINDEEWPPLISEADVPMRYPKEIKKTNRFALGHSFFGLVPGLFMYSTIWLREQIGRAHV